MGRSHLALGHPCKNLSNNIWLLRAGQLQFVAPAWRGAWAALPGRGEHPELAGSPPERCLGDVVVDARAGSPNYDKWVTAEYSAENWQQLVIPGSFLHAFCTLVPDTEVKSDRQLRRSKRGVIWNDPDLALPS